MACPERAEDHLVESYVNLHTRLPSPNLLSIVLDADNSAPHHQLLIGRCGFPIPYLHTDAAKICATYVMCTFRYQISYMTEGTNTEKSSAQVEV